ncbi:MAG: hypothetical protein RI963_2492 [Planctomycetota bacterium]
MTSFLQPTVIRFVLGICLGVSLTLSPRLFAAAADPEGAPPKTDPGNNHSKIDFARDIQPILAERCLLCHGPDEAEAGLRLDLAEHATRKLDSGETAIRPGEPETSELIRRVTTDDPDKRMPPEGEPLTVDQVRMLREWVEQGAEYSRHWAFEPIRQPTLPPVSDPQWCVNELDRFVLAKLDELGIKPSPEKGRESLIRRLYADLIGLPPTIEELDAFLTDDRPEAYERVVDRLLQSDHFGERWGRHWLDMARYADSDGYEKDKPRPNAWRYRDWVIDAVNRDLPLDRFAIEQLAGDLIEGASPMQRLATAFHRQTLTNTEGGADQEQFRVEATFDRTETTAAVWMALTMGCARCHTHKYDPLSHRDYYRLFAIFNAASETETEVLRDRDDDAGLLAGYAKQKAQHDAAVASLQRQIDDLIAAEDPQAKGLQTELDALQKSPPQSPLMKVAVLKEQGRTTHRLERGDFLQPAEALTGGVPEVLLEVHPLNSRRPDQAPDRLDLAIWLVDPNHPLTPRVVVNQIWQRLFGRGLVPTLNDFGVRGERPTHPELLDWLAWRLPRELKWSRKGLIKEIVMSATYRQASRHREELREIDPTNRWLARQNRVRVEAEVVRDLALASSGLLDPRIGGPSVFPPLPPGVTELSYANNFSWTLSSGGDRYRRGMYTFFKRTAPHPTLITFDCPDSNTTQVGRETSNTPLQALTLLNNVVFAEAAVAMARRVMDEFPGDDADRLRGAFRLTLSRYPEQEELDRFGELLTAARGHYAAHPEDASKLVAIAANDAVETKPTPTADVKTEQAKQTAHASPGDTAEKASPSDTAELAAWGSTLRILINLDEFIVRE